MNLFKKSKIQRTMPDYKMRIDEAFKVTGEQYYYFKDTSDMPTLRYYRFSQFLTEFEMRISRDFLLEVTEKCISSLNEGNLVRAAAMLTELVSRAKLIIETDTLYRLASVVYFTLDEDVTDYDYTINEQKIKKFKEEGLQSFFFKMPCRDFLPQINISKKDMEDYLKLQKLSTANIRALMDDQYFIEKKKTADTTMLK